MRYALLAAIFVIAQVCPAADDVDPETRACHEAIIRYQVAILSGDPAAIRAACVNTEGLDDVVDALAAEGKARAALGEAYRSATGQTLDLPYTNERALRERVIDWPMEYCADRASTLWGGSRLRKTEGSWSIDLAEMDYAGSLRELIPYFRARGNVYRKLGQQLSTQKRVRVIEAKGQLRDAENEAIYVSGKESLAIARKTSFERHLKAARGTYEVSVSNNPADQAANVQVSFEATVVIGEDSIAFTCPTPALNGTWKIQEADAMNLGNIVSLDDTTSPVISVSWNRFVERFSGSMTIRGETPVFLTISGRRIKPENGKR